jgi:glycosyltransferase involved in cell wall biosynthesis
MAFADVIFLTDEHRRQLLASRHFGKVEIIGNVPSPMTTSAIKRPRKSQFRVCYAGGIHEHRGLKVIARAVEPLEDVETVFAGWVPRKVDLDFIQSQRHLKYLGKLSYERSLELMASSDIILAFYDVALPINAMASSNKVFEAMSLKKPVITNRETTMADLVQKERCGILVPYGDVNALREAILKLQKNKKLRQRLGKQGWDAFVSKYNWPVMESRLLRKYEDLVGKNSSEKWSTYSPA